MGDENDRSEDRTKLSRQQRLKHALRENLKRRKSQLRERGKQVPSPRHQSALDDESGKK